MPGRLYQDETGAFWVGTEDARYAQASRDGYAVVPHYLRRFRDVDDDLAQARVVADSLYAAVRVRPRGMTNSQYARLCEKLAEIKE